jgi:hypothetical protein
VTTLLEYLDRTADLDLDIGTTPIPGIEPYLGVDPSDVHLRAQYAEAIDWVHQALSERDFVDDDGNDVNPDDAVVLGVYAYVRATRDLDARGSTGTKKTKTGAREEEYADAGQDTYLLPAQAAWPKIQKFCEDPTLFASGGA